MQGEGDVLWVFLAFSQQEIQLGRRRLNVSDLYTITSRTANISLESSISGLLGDIFSFKIKVGVYEKLAKSVLPRVLCQGSYRSWKSMESPGI